MNAEGDTPEVVPQEQSGRAVLEAGLHEPDKLSPTW